MDVHLKKRRQGLTALPPYYLVHVPCFYKAKVLIYNLTAECHQNLSDLSTAGSTGGIKKTVSLSAKQPHMHGPLQSFLSPSRRIFCIGKISQAIADRGINTLLVGIILALLGLDGTIDKM